jgi:phenylacetate-CoA ligase
MTRQDVVGYLDLIDQYEVRYLYGYPSAIDLLCRHMLELGRSPRLPIRGVLPISEPLLSHQRAMISDALGGPRIANFYGLSEKVLFAYERDDAEDVYEFEPLYGHVELVDDAGEPITEPGREGRIVGTGFLSTGMPFIRYDTADRATLVELPTAANGQRMRLAGIVPRRKPNYQISEDGNRVVTIDFTPEHPRFFRGIDEYQFYQDTPGRVTFKYVSSPDGTDQDAVNVAADLQHRARDRIRFFPQRVDCLAGGRAGKRAFVDQRIDLGVY